MDEDEIFFRNQDGEEVQAYPAGVAHYKGDATDAVGQVFGPTTYGTLVVASKATYDDETNVTTVEFVYKPEGVVL